MIIDDEYNGPSEDFNLSESENESFLDNTDSSDDDNTADILYKGLFSDDESFSDNEPNSAEGNRTIRNI